MEKHSKLILISLTLFFLLFTGCQKKVVVSKVRLPDVKCDPVVWSFFSDYRTPKHKEFVEVLKCLKKSRDTIHNYNKI